MPFERKIISSSGIIGIWDLSDSLEHLISLCQVTNTEKQKFEKLTIEKRKKEFLATRILLHQLSDKTQEIAYQKTGKPFLKNNSQNISISHSADYATVFLSDKNIGIDVERTTRNIDKIAKRFLHPEEQEFIEEGINQQQAKTLFWSAKEAIFKCSSAQEVQFNKHIRIKPFPIAKDGDFHGSLLLNNKKEKFCLHYTFLKNNVLVYCVEQ